MSDYDDGGMSGILACTRNTAVGSSGAHRQTRRPAALVGAARAYCRHRRPDLRQCLAVPQGAPQSAAMMTRLWIMSDLHLEAVAFPEAFKPVPPNFDVLVVAGDVCEGDKDGALRKVRNLANDKPAVFVLGNHEFWGRDVARERRTAPARGRATWRRAAG